MAVIYDPSKIKLVTSKYLGTKGEYLVDMSKREGAVLAINGGGFADANGLGDGGEPIGTVIKDRQILNYETGGWNRGIIGFTNDNKLYLGKISALVEILLKYHAYNAANLDGGNSSVLVVDNEIINHPFNWDNKEETRPIPDGFILVP